MSENEEKKNDASNEEADVNKTTDSKDSVNTDEAKKNEEVKEEGKNSEEVKNEESNGTTEIPFSDQSKGNSETPKQEQEKWYCEKCGEENIGNFCYKCGAPKPQPSGANDENKDKQKKEPGSPVPDTRQKDKKTKEHHSVFTKARVITCVIAMILGLGAGYIGGKIAGNQAVEEIEEAVENSQGSGSAPERQQPEFGFDGEFGENDEGSSKGSSDSSGDSTVPFAKAAIGVTVEQDSDVGYSGCVIAAFTNGSNAEDAGLEIGDIISEIDGEEMTSYADIRDYLSTKEAGDTVEITVIRDGEEVIADVELINSGNQQ